MNINALINVGKAGLRFIGKNRVTIAKYALAILTGAGINETKNYFEKSKKDEMINDYKCALTKEASKNAYVIQENGELKEIIQELLVTNNVSAEGA